jgi:hypothetical protein
MDPALDSVKSQAQMTAEFRALWMAAGIGAVNWRPRDTLGLAGALPRVGRS